MSEESARAIEQKTIGQFENLDWFRSKKGRISASIAKECCGQGNPAAKIKKVITVGKVGGKGRGPHMAYGIEHEDIAAEMFEQKLKAENHEVNLRKCGLFISIENPVLAASPDRVGTIDGEEVVVEIKCLSASRDTDPKSAATKKQKDSNFAFRLIDNQLQVKQNHRYFFQVQMQMAVSRRQHAYMVIFTNESTPVEYTKVPFDEEFWAETQQKLLDFHSQYILPALILQRFGAQQLSNSDSN